MKVLILAGPPSSGKTAIILHTAKHLLGRGIAVACVKFDTQSSQDPETFTSRLGVPAIGGLSGYLCPDHYCISNMEEALDWGKEQHAECLFVETAGLCLRCAPHIEGVPAITVVDCLGGIQAPEKMGPMLTQADIVLLTKGDLISQAEREVISYRVRSCNPGATVYPVNGLMGTGSLHLVRAILNSPEISCLEGSQLRHDMPAAICSYCTGEKRVGRRFQAGSVEKLCTANSCTKPLGERHDDAA